jgi:hypothetical protein
MFLELDVDNVDEYQNLMDDPGLQIDVTNFTVSLDAKRSGNPF